MQLISPTTLGWATLMLQFSECQAVSFGFGKHAKDASGQKRSVEPLELASLRKPIWQDQLHVYSQALDLISSAQSSPSCQRVATSTLLDSCHSIDGTSTDSESSLDDVRSIYAAQLALCEIIKAEAGVPSTCRFLDLSNTDGKSAPTRPLDVPKEGLSRCLQTLESRPQWWTSYSNNRQNAVIICEAARVDIEKDDLIRLHKNFVETQSKADSALRQAVQRYAELVKDQGDAYVSLKKTINKQILDDIQTASEKATSLTERLANGLDATVQGVLARLSSAVSSVEIQIDDLGSNADAANGKTRHLENSIQRIFQMAAEGNAELASIQTKHLGDSSLMILGLQQSLQSMKEMDMQDIVAVIGQMQGQMRTTNDLMNAIATKQHGVASQLLQLNDSMASLQANAHSLQQAQEKQAASQAWLQDEMESSLKSALGRLLEVQEHAVNLHKTIQDVLEPLSHITAIAGVFNRFWILGSFIVGAAFLATVISRLNRSLAMIMLVTICLLLLIKFTQPIITDFDYRKFDSVSLTHLITLGFSVSILISIFMIHRYKASKKAEKPRRPEKADFSFLRSLFIGRE